MNPAGLVAAVLTVVAHTANVSAPASTNPGGRPTAAAPVDRAQVPPQLAWARSELHLEGWTLVTSQPDLLVFVKRVAGGSASNPQLLTRGEHYPLAPTNPIGNGESLLTHSELDCVGGRSRGLSSTVYSGSDLQGAIVAASDTPGPWRPIAPNTMGAAEAKALCGAGSSPSAAPKKADPHP